MTLEIWILDEPKSNLDAGLHYQLLFERRELYRNLGRTFVLVTHDQIEAMSMATKVAMVDQGYVQKYGTPYDVFHRPENLFVAKFIGVNKKSFLEGENRLSEGASQFVIGPIPRTFPTMILGLRPKTARKQRSAFGQRISIARRKGWRDMIVLKPILQSSGLN